MKSLLLIAVCASVAWSQGDSVGRKREAATKTQQSAAPDQRGTKQFSIVVQPLPTRVSQRQASDETQEKSDKAWNDTVTAYSTLVIAVFTISLAIVTALLFGSGERTYRHLQESSHKELRAYISVTPTGLDMNSKKAPLRFFVKLLNHGQTPAISGTISMSMKFGARLTMEDDAYKFVDEPETDRVSKFVLQPHQDMAGISRKREWPITELESEQIITGKNEYGEDVRLYCYGTVRYSDMFGLQHWTNYCFVYGGELSMGRTGKDAFAICHLHNGIGTEGMHRQGRWRRLVAAWPAPPSQS